MVVLDLLMVGGMKERAVPELYILLWIALRNKKRGYEPRPHSRISSKHLHYFLIA